MAAASVLDRIKSRIGVAGPPVTTVVEAGHLKRFAEAIGDPNPRWREQAPPTFMVALAPTSYHLPEAEDYGKGWLNGGNRFDYLEPVHAGDTVVATSKVVDVYEKTGGSGSLLFIIFETEYVNQHGRAVARLRGTAIRR
jgi:hypothetical protein